MYLSKAKVSEAEQTDGDGAAPLEGMRAPRAGDEGVPEPALLTAAQRRVLAFVVAALRRRGIPFQVTGGLAAIAYGARRPLFDIDLDVRRRDLERVRRVFRGHIAADLERFEDEHFEVPLITLRIDGVSVDLTAADELVCKTPDGRRVPFQQDLERAGMLPVGGVEVPVQNRSELLAYKRLIARPTDLEDVAAIERAAG